MPDFLMHPFWAVAGIVGAFTAYILYRNRNSEGGDGDSGSSSWESSSSDSSSSDSGGGDSGGGGDGGGD